MTRDDLLARLDNVKRRTGNRYRATCPAHSDTHPSLQITEGERGLLLKCWSGCTVPEICAALHITQQDLFYDAGDLDLARRREAAHQRERERQQQEAAARKQGRRLDALRAADDHIRSRCGLDISRWSNQKLHDELNLLADAHALLASEECDG